MSRQLHFGWFLGAGFGVQGWGKSGYGIGYDWKQPDIYRDAARYFESAGLEVFIIEDGVTVPDTYGGSAEVNLALARFAPKHDPLPLTPLLLQATSRLTIVPTISTSFYPPYTAARYLATVDHFAPGRIGVNIVTSGSDLAAQNYGLDRQTEHDLRYDRADEWLQVVKALWNSWDHDAVVEDEENLVYADFTKVRPIDHRGEHFAVRGPLNTVRPTSEPLLVQAGASERGRRFGGTHAELVIAPGSTAQQARDYRDSIRAQAVAAGRSPDDVRVLFIVEPTVTANAAETEQVLADRGRLTQRAIDEDLQGVSYTSGIDFKRFDLDAPLPQLETNSNQASLRSFAAAAGEGATLRQILQARATGGKEWLVGTADEIADRLEEFHELSGADGFLFTGHIHPVGLHRALDGLVPVLQSRGLLRRELAEGGARANLFA